MDLSNIPEDVKYLLMAEKQLQDFVDREATKGKKISAYAYNAEAVAQIDYPRVATALTNFRKCYLDCRRDYPTLDDNEIRCIICNSFPEDHDYVLYDMQMEKPFVLLTSRNTPPEAANTLLKQALMHAQARKGKVNYSEVQKNKSSEMDNLKKKWGLTEEQVNKIQEKAKQEMLQQ